MAVSVCREITDPSQKKQWIVFRGIFMYFPYIFSGILLAQAIFLFDCNLAGRYYVEVSALVNHG